MLKDTNDMALAEAWFKKTGEFSCKVPSGMPLGVYNVSFNIPNSHGSSIVKPQAVTHGFGEESPAYWSLEVVPKVESVRPLPAGLVALAAAGLDAGADAEVTLGGEACPEVASQRAYGRIVCNRTAALVAAATRAHGARPAVLC